MDLKIKNDFFFLLKRRKTKRIMNFKRCQGFLLKEQKIFIFVCRVGEYCKNYENKASRDFEKVSMFELYWVRSVARYLA